MTWLITLGLIVLYFLAYHAVVMVVLVQEFSEATGWLDAVVLALFGLATITVVRFCWFLKRGLGAGLPGTPEMVALLAPPVALWVAGLADPGLALFTAVPLWSAVNAAAPLLSGLTRWAWLLAGAMAVAAHPVLSELLHPQTTVEGLFSWWVGPLAYLIATLPLMVLSSVWWWEIVVRLDQSRRLAGELAVVRERLRFSADLHDIQGHHLQVIALKAELAERLLETDPDAARDNIHETRLLARTALKETRSLVQGYRKVGLDEELANAADVLSAAGIACHLAADTTVVGGGPQHLLGLVIREATTNILRHSHATQVSINLTHHGQDIVLKIHNDGLVHHPPFHPEPDPTATDAGTGLASLRTRLTAAGGSLHCQVDDDWFLLCATVPSPPPGATA